MLLLLLLPGEHMDQFEMFETKRFVSRLLGRGDVSGLMDKIQVGIGAARVRVRVRGRYDGVWGLGRGGGAVLCCVWLWVEVHDLLYNTNIQEGRRCCGVGVAPTGFDGPHMICPRMRVVVSCARCCLWAVVPWF
jgi:hypothetical protein